MSLMTLKCVGAVGAVQVSSTATVGDLVAALEKLAAVPTGGLKVIAGGRRVITEGDNAAVKLSDIGITDKSK